MFVAAWLGQRRPELDWIPASDESDGFPKRAISLPVKIRHQGVARFFTADSDSTLSGQRPDQLIQARPSRREALADRTSANRDTRPGDGGLIRGEGESKFQCFGESALPR